jgi:formylglycine-generating enzyme required for sulfatase activity
MVMVYVPEGEFTMGSTEGFSDEEPMHTVYLDAYWIDRTEVTNAMYAVFLNEMGNQSEGGTTWLDARDGDVKIGQSGGTWQTMSGFTNHPVTEVSWYGAQAYCAWADDSRLPTEAEWEKAARGTDGRTYPWGNESPTCSLVNFFFGCGHNTSEVDSHLAGASPYGVYALAGNVREWVADWYGETYYNVSPSKNPQGPANGDYRVLRGGAWNGDENITRSANRNWNYPDKTFYHVGFRCAQSDTP